MALQSLPQLGSDGRILEAIVTTANEDGTTNIAPMGPLVDEGMQTFVLRPFRTSTTYQNLLRTAAGVLHITDDVLLFARAAVGNLHPEPMFLPDQPLVLADVCRWYRFEIVSVDDSSERSVMIAQTTEKGRLRDGFGFNRAKHAVLEAAILATRVQFLPAAELVAEYERLEVPIHKTGGTDEHRAFRLLESFVKQALQSSAERAL